jgi:hypothetical protein
MKTNNIFKYIGTCAFAALTLSSCNDFLDSESYTQSNTQNFPSSMNDVEMLVTSMYANLNHQAAHPESSYLLTNLFASDDMLTGAQDASLDHLMISNDSQFDFLWDIHYKGIYAANTCLEGLNRMEQAGNVNDQQMFNQRMGEAYFMRAYQYYELAELFGGVPLITSTTQETNVPRATDDEVWAQIASDLKNAIELMANKKYNEYVESGHATKWAAEALMARCFLFYTGFYQKDAMPTAEGGSITKQDVTGWLTDCIQNSGHHLVGDFRDLWAYTNDYTVNDYKYTAGKTGVDGQPLRWAGNGNPEEVFAVKFGNFAGYTYENQGGYANLYLAFFGIASKSDNGAAFPFGNTNSFGTVPQCLWNSWGDNSGDLRQCASIIVAKDEFDMANMESGGVRGQWEETGLWNKKLQPILSKQAYEKSGSWANSLFWTADPNFTGMTDAYIQPRWSAMFEDLYVIRFADVLLMQSELTGDAKYMNMVRARAGLPAIGYSLEALQQERRHELAFEGQRYADIRRWHIAEQALSEQNNSAMQNLGVETVMRNGKYSERYKATNGFFPIPLKQIQLSNGTLTQNAGWDTPDARYTVWNFDK